MNIHKKLKKKITNALYTLSLIGEKDVHLEHPTDITHGDYSTNVAFIYAPIARKAPKELAEEIVHELYQEKDGDIEKIEVAGSGFINFFLSASFFASETEEILSNKDVCGKNSTQKGRKILIEYTDANPFKEFHVGHMMSNAIGESLARLHEYSGAEVRRANYQGDVGLHVAMTLWGLMEESHHELNVRKLGNAYAYGSSIYKKNEEIRRGIDEVNKQLNKGTLGEHIAKLYIEGKRVSLEHFETLYRKLDTHFDFYFFESDTGSVGEKIVRTHIGSVFEESEGAIVFHGEKYGLHTRVFITKNDYPVYEAKELGLVKMKNKTYPHDISIVVTGNEVTQYFKVVLKALELYDKESAQKTRHVPHGMLRLPSGKMSSRTGDVILAEALIEEAMYIVLPKIKENQDIIDEVMQKKLAETIAIGAIKYSILSHAMGGDIVFDFKTALSFIGDSGPYLQYTHARARSLLRKAEGRVSSAPKDFVSEKVSSRMKNVLRLLHRFPGMVVRAQKENAPHYIASFLIQLSRTFNVLYAEERIIESDEMAYKVAIVEATATVLKNGLYLLGIKAPDRM